jgi:hypothetical protein
MMAALTQLGLDKMPVPSGAARSVFRPWAESSPEVKVTKLALLEPPLNDDDDASKQEFEEYAQHITDLLGAGRPGDAVALFLADMVPPDVLEGMKRSPEMGRL